MPRKKNRRPAPPTAPEVSPERLNEPFAVLADLKKQLAANRPEPKTAPPPLAPPAPPPLADEALFRREMADVRPLGRLRRLAREAPEPKAWQTPEWPNEDLEALKHLSELVSGRGEFDLTYTDEHVEGQVKGLAPNLMELLRAGRMPFQDHLDLHGLTVTQAEASVTRFILDSVALGRACVLLIHGRGQRSKDGVPVLKRYLEHFLLKGAVRKHILAFTTARPVDGGPGASYILLKR